MAEEQAKENVEQEKAPEPKEKSGGSKKLLFIIIGVVVVIAGGLGAAFALGVFSGDAEADTPGAETDKAKPTLDLAKVGPVMKLTPFVVNLADEDEDRYLKATVEIEVANEEVMSACEQRLARVTDALISLFSSKSYSQIRDVKGKIKLRQEIVVRVNEVLGSRAVSQVYFTEFLVQ